MNIGLTSGAGGVPAGGVAGVPVGDAGGAGEAPAGGVPGVVAGFFCLLIRAPRISPSNPLTDVSLPGENSSPFC